MPELGLHYSPAIMLPAIATPATQLAMMLSSEMAAMMRHPFLNLSMSSAKIATDLVLPMPAP